MNDSLHEEIKKLEGPIVIFGASGFIGANLFRTILSTRSDCYGVTHFPYVNWRLTGLSVEKILWADVTDRASVSRIFDRFEFKTIFNFASYGNYSKQNDIPEIYQTNILGAMNILEIARQKGFTSCVQAGTSSEYGINCEAPKENAELMPNSHYAVSKVSISYLIKYYGLIAKLPVINLRYYSVYGPFEETDRLIPRLIENAMEHRLPPLVDPEISRDFLYVEDAVEATILAASTGVQKAAGQSINIATGKKTTLRELVHMAREQFQIEEEPKWSSMLNRFWDLRNWYGNPSYAEQILKWRARFSLREGLTKTMAWMQQKTFPTVDPNVKLGEPVRISAVIACYKDAQAIPVMYERLSQVFNQMRVDYEIIFVNDGSPDDTDEVLSRITAQDTHVIGVEHSRNFGSQNAFISGMQISSGDAVVLLDGDLQDPPEVIPEFFEKWREGYEVVYGRREKRLGSQAMAFSYKFFYRVFRHLSYIPIPLDAGDFSLMDRKVVNTMLELPETEQFLRGLRAWVGFKQVGVPYTRSERLFGKTTNNWYRNIGWAKKAIFSFSFAPLEILSFLGAILTGMSFLLFIAQIIAKLLWPNVPHGITTIIILILFFGGVQILAISIIGEYLIKIFEETKRRPKFIRKAIRHGTHQWKMPEQADNFLQSHVRKTGLAKRSTAANLPKL